MVTIQSLERKEAMTEGVKKKQLTKPTLVIYFVTTQDGGAALAFLQILVFKRVVLHSSSTLTRSASASWISSP